MVKQQVKSDRHRSGRNAPAAATISLGVKAGGQGRQSKDEVSHLFQEVARMAEAQRKGETDALIPLEFYSGECRAVAEAINGIATSDNEVRAKTMACIDEFSKGNFEVELDRFTGKKAYMNDTIERLRGSMKGVIVQLNRMSDEHNRGDIDVYIPADQFVGSFRTMAEGVNGMVAGHIAVKRKAMACVDEFSRGNFDAPLERFAGKKAFINDTIERLRANLKAFIFGDEPHVGRAHQGRHRRVDSSG